MAVKKKHVIQTGGIITALGTIITPIVLEFRKDEDKIDTLQHQNAAMIAYLKENQGDIKQELRNIYRLIYGSH